MAAHPLRKAAYAPGVALAALAGTAAPAFVLFAIGLILDERFLLVLGYPVAGLLAGTVGALCAAWAGNLLAPDRSRTRLGPVLLRAAAASLAGVAVLVVAFLLRPGILGGPFAALLLPFLLLVPATAAWSTLRLRRPRSSLKRDAWLSAGLLALVPVALAALVALGCLVDMCGA